MITTHYIEEARRADTVALVRDGRLLAEANPEDLLVKHDLSSLEMVFLKICQQAEELDTNMGNLIAKVELEEVDIATTSETGADVYSKSDQTELVTADNPKNIWAHFPQRRGLRSSMNKINTLMYKSVTRMRRNIPFVSFQVSLQSQTY